MRTVTLAAVLLTLTTSSVALAKGPAKTKKGKEKAPEPVLVAAAEPLPELPPAEPAAPAPAPVVEAPPSKDKSAAAPASDEPPTAGTGFVLTIGSGAGFLGGEAVEGIDIASALVTFDVKLGGYLTPQFGIMAGLQGGYGALIEGCAGTCSNGYAYQIPVVAQYAFKDRSRGAYVEGGLALFTTYGGSTKSDSGDSPEALKVSAPVDFKVGAGYRFPMGAASDKAATTALDLRFGADLGQFKKVEYSSVGGSVDGDIASAHQAMHFALGLSVGYHFAP
ncbi:MAG: hypothetical protein KF764_19900 [Labilithrix sp.]|nr:hypothetical protein [Labilithrix sp.]